MPGPYPALFDHPRALARIVVGHTVVVADIVPLLPLRMHLVRRIPGGQLLARRRAGDTGAKRLDQHQPGGRVVDGDDEPVCRDLGEGVDTVAANRPHSIDNDGAVAILDHEMADEPTAGDRLAQDQVIEGGTCREANGDLCSILRDHARHGPGESLPHGLPQFGHPGAVAIINQGTTIQRNFE